jgi:HK97 family phage major capsid protein
MIRKAQSSIETFTTNGQKKIDELAAKNAELLERLEVVESWRKSPGRTPESRGSAEEREHKARFLNWIRRPHDHAAQAQLAEAQSELEQKTVTTTAGANGGFAVPEEISRDIERRAKALNPFRQLVTVRQVGTSRYHELVDMADDASGWVGETDTRSATDAATLRDREPSMGTVYAYPKTTEEALSDVLFDVGAWLSESTGESFAVQEALAIVSGNGVNKPTGFLDTAPGTTPDDASPLRDPDELLYVPGLAGSPAALDADALIHVATGSLKERYLIGEGVAWVMSRSALSQVRQLKDGSGRYIWSESLTLGVPSTLLGYPVYTTDAMPAIGAGTFPMAFGNWRRGYVLVERTGLRITVDDNITAPGFVKFYVRRRVGGCIRNNDAVRAVKWATT